MLLIFDKSIIQPFITIFSLELTFHSAEPINPLDHCSFSKLSAHILSQEAFDEFTIGARIGLLYCGIFYQFQQFCLILITGGETDYPLYIKMNRASFAEQNVQHQ